MIDTLDWALVCVLCLALDVTLLMIWRRMEINHDRQMRLIECEAHRIMRELGDDIE